MSDKINLNDILRLSKEEIAQTKVRLITNNGHVEPLDVFKNDPKKLFIWNFWNGKNKNYNNTKYSIGLINMKGGRWLLFTVAKITKDLNVLGQVAYEYEELEQYRPLFGRVIVKYNNKVQAMVRKAEGLIDEIEILEILPNIYTGENFSGYEKVRLSYKELKIAVYRNKTYINAFKSQKAIYLITDMSNGKLYVGSATSNNNMLLNRWQTYVQNGHGGNKNLKDICNDHNRGFE